MKLYVARIRDPVSGTERHVICTLRPVMDGGMYEFIDPESGQCVGCVGAARREEFVRPLGEYLDAVTPATLEALGVLTDALEWGAAPWL